MAHILDRCAIDNDFVKQTSTVAQYNIGAEVTIAPDQVGIPTTYKYVKAASALTANQPYVLVNNADGITTAAPATSTVAKIIGIPQVAIASGSYGWVAIGGLCQAKTGIQAKGDTLEVLNSGTTLVVDGSSGSPAETAGTVAISCEAAAAAATVTVNLLNKRVTIAAS
ncbi:MAG: hypothetical protein IIZ99_00230 [Turicibacter sp.]|nr:hypothetical protein [Turicibacter sp.]